jgi:hypothetical protein
LATLNFDNICLNSEPVWHDDRVVNMVDLVRHTSHWKTRRLFLGAVSSSLTRVKDKRHRCVSDEYWGAICSVKFAFKGTRDRVC